ncbi:MAG: holo-ACP synthase [Acidobacteria bacterium]|nr:holo-ACP synthase [Acidobacteriota bacterium]
MCDDEDVVARALEVLAIDAVAASSEAFTEGERAYARSKSDPERRLAARLAAKRAAARALGGGVAPDEIEVLPGRGGPPRLALGERARARMGVLGASRALVSLTHGETHAAALVLLVRDA